MRDNRQTIFVNIWIINGAYTDRKINLILSQHEFVDVIYFDYSALVCLTAGSQTLLHTTTKIKRAKNKVMWKINVLHKHTQTPNTHRHTAQTNKQIFQETITNQKAQSPDACVCALIGWKIYGPRIYPPTRQRPHTTPRHYHITYAPKQVFKFSKAQQCESISTNDRVHDRQATRYTISANVLVN